MKKFLAALMLLMLSMVLTALNVSTVEAADKDSLRLARLPILILSSTPDKETMTGLELKVSRAVHLPLNGTLQAIEYIPTAESTAAMQEVWNKIYRKNKKAKLEEAMEPLAKKLKADMVVCPVLRRFSQEFALGTALSERSENYLISHASVELIVFDNRTKELVSKKESQSYSGEDVTWGTARFLADACMSKVIEQTELRNRVMQYTPLGKNHVPIERKVIG